MSALLSIIFMAAMTPWRAFVLFKIWFWFLVPVWPMLAAPKWNIYGIGIIVGWLTMNGKRDKEKTQADDWGYYATASFLSPAIILFIAWVIKAICL